MISGSDLKKSNSNRLLHGRNNQRVIRLVDAPIEHRSPITRFVNINIHIHVHTLFMCEYIYIYEIEEE